MRDLREVERSCFGSFSSSAKAVSAFIAGRLSCCSASWLRSIFRSFSLFSLCLMSGSGFSRFPDSFSWSSALSVLGFDLTDEAAESFPARPAVFLTLFFSSWTVCVFVGQDESDFFLFCDLDSFPFLSGGFWQILSLLLFLRDSALTSSLMFSIDCALFTSFSWSFGLYLFLHFLLFFILLFHCFLLSFSAVCGLFMLTFTVISLSSVVISGVFFWTPLGKKRTVEPMSPFAIENLNNLKTNQ